MNVNEFYEAFSKHQSEEHINDVRLTRRYRELINLFPPISEKRKRNLIIIVPVRNILSDLNTNARSFTPSPKTTSPQTPSFFDLENSPTSLLEQKKRIYRKRK